MSPQADFPSNDVVIREVMAVLQDRTGWTDLPTLERGIVAWVAGGGALGEPEEGKRMVHGSVAFCVEILCRDGLAETRSDRSVRATAEGLKADAARVDSAWRREVERGDPVETFLRYLDFLP